MISKRKGSIECCGVNLSIFIILLNILAVVLILKEKAFC